MQRLRLILPALKVVMVTSDRNDEMLFTSLRAGADGYVTKPCDRTMLARTTEQAHSSARGFVPKRPLVLGNASGLNRRCFMKPSTAAAKRCLGMVVVLASWEVKTDPVHQPGRRVLQSTKQRPK